MTFSKEKMRGTGTMVLNGIRIVNIFALLSVAAASWMMTVIAGLTGKFEFFDALSHIFTSLIAGFLFASECEMGRKYLADVWPVLSDDHGFFWLGFALLALGFNVMADLTKPANFTGNLGLHQRGFVMAAGILSITAGVFNIIATFFFGDRKGGITARMVRRNGSLARSEENSADYYSQGSRGSRNNEKESGPAKWAKRASRMFAKKPETSSGGRPEISRPYAAKDLERGSFDDDRVSPIDSNTRRPPSDAHPIKGFKAPPPVHNLYNRRNSTDTEVTEEGFGNRPFTQYSAVSRPF